MTTVIAANKQVNKELNNKLRTKDKDRVIDSLHDIVVGNKDMSSFDVRKLDGTKNTIYAIRDGDWRIGFCFEGDKAKILGVEKRAKDYRSKDAWDSRA